ncbi:hypothetical protein [Dyella sp. 2HG41-7]|uniref:hypothetical protein n=1 Tax=Dyella sp. 2HG41-7 TaxID=2883239 RepID=UPI001F2DE6BD|nr:hypothetical protein [Dyella sp. 2HG41-7]
MIDTHEKPRKERTPEEYAGQVLDSAANSLMALGFVKDEADFIDRMFNFAANAHAKHGLGGDDWYLGFTDGGHKRIYSALENKGLVPKNARPILSNRGFWGLVACGYCVQAIAAYRAGDVTEAWTYVVDARFAADSLLSQLTDIEMVKLDRINRAKKAVGVKLANDPTQAAKTDAHKLWRDWRSGAAIFKSAAAFDRHIVEKFPAVTATKTVERWRKEWSDQEAENRDSAS